MYLPCISLAARKNSSPSLKLTNPYPLLFVVRLSLITLAFCTEAYFAKALSRDSSVTSPAKLPTKSRKCAGSHSSREGSCHVSPPPERTTVLAGLEGSTGPAVTVGAGVAVSPRLPSGCRLALPPVVVLFASVGAV
jgi:hypothetical protein